MGIPVQRNSIGKKVRILIRDSTTGLGKTGLLYNTSGLVLAWAKKGDATVTAITKVSTTPGAAWTTGGFVELDAAKAKGVYEVDMPDAAWASATEYTHLFWTGTGIIDDGDIFPITLVDAFALDYFSSPQPEQSVKPAIDNSTGADRLNFVFHAARNPQVTTATTRTLTKADGEADPTTGTTLALWELTDDGTKFVEKPV